MAGTPTCRAHPADWRCQCADARALITLCPPHAPLSLLLAATCPSSSQLSDALREARIATPAGRTGLYTIPAAPKAVVNAGFLGNVADITVNGLRGGVKGDIDFETLETSFRVTSTGGSAAIESSLLGNQQPLDLVGRAFSGSGCTIGAPSAGTEVQLQCYGLQLSQPVETADVKATLWLKGDLVASGDLSSATLIDASKIPAASE